MSRSKLVVRRGDLERGPRLRFLFGAFRFALYGFLGLGCEVLFYNLVRAGRSIPGVELLFRFSWKTDPRLGLDHIWSVPPVALFGQCSLWMFLVYALASIALIEPIYRHVARWPFPLRALLYGVAILVFEAICGLGLKALTGYAIWYYDDALSILGMTSLYILPLWMATGLLVELIYRELMDPKVRRAIESELVEAKLPPPG
jgi:hypothetical protein